MTPKDATEEEIKAAIAEAELAADGYAWHTKTDVMVATALKRGQAIERARVCKELRAKVEAQITAYHEADDGGTQIYANERGVLRGVLVKLNEIEAA